MARRKSRKTRKSRNKSKQRRSTAPVIKVVVEPDIGQRISAKTVGAKRRVGPRR